MARKKAEALESMIKRGGGVTKHQALATDGLAKKTKGRKVKKDKKP
jgi:hypothetical protein